tara:strand:- start:566 stop:802 length:237 start_codon:yes stop_codon:yes gene_type:complete
MSSKYQKILKGINRFFKLLFFSIFYYRQVNLDNKIKKKKIKKLEKENLNLKKEIFFLKKKLKKKEKIINRIFNLKILI